VIAKIDCTVDNDLCSKFEVKGYPTIFFFKNGNKKEYDGPRNTDGIVNWLDKHSGPIATHITTSEQLQEFAPKTSSAIGFFKNEESNLYKTFIAAADDANVQEIKFGYVTDKTLFGENKEESIKLKRDEKLGGDLVIPQDHLDSAKALANFLFDKTFPLVGKVGPDNFKQYVNRAKPLYLAFVETKKPTKHEYIDLVSRIALNFPQFSFGYISAEKFGSNMERMGASGKVIPTMVRLTFAENKPIAFDREGQFNEESLLEWIEGTVSGKYKYKLKSEAVPEVNNNPVTVLVGSTFDEIVHDKNKDVLVEFYAPWCGHCKTLVPEYDKLAEAFKGVDDVVISKIDLTANDIDSSHFDVKGFPTILLYKSSDKTKPVEFKGTRDAKSLAAWIKDNSKSASAKAVNHDEL